MITLADKERILGNQDIQIDTLQEEPDLGWSDISNGGYFDYEHPRPIPREVAQKAVSYIKVCVSHYPFQLQFRMAQPLWNRFAQSWCEDGDEARALRAI